MIGAGGRDGIEVVVEVVVGIEADIDFLGDLGDRGDFRSFVCVLLGFLVDENENEEDEDKGDDDDENRVEKAGKNGGKKGGYVDDN